MQSGWLQDLCGFSAEETVGQQHSDDILPGHHRNNAADSRHSQSGLHDLLLYSINTTTERGEVSLGQQAVADQEKDAAHIVRAGHCEHQHKHGPHKGRDYIPRADRQQLQYKNGK